MRAARLLLGVLLAVLVPALILLGLLLIASTP